MARAGGTNQAYRHCLTKAPRALRPVSPKIHSNPAGAVAPRVARSAKGKPMSIGTLLLILLILMLVGALPSWPHSASWGYGPSGGLGLVLLVVVILMLTGRI
jgi:hypothetical protein